MMRLKLFNTPVWLPALKGEGMWVIPVWPPDGHAVTGFAPNHCEERDAIPGPSPTSAGPGGQSHAYSAIPQAWLGKACDVVL